MENKMPASRRAEGLTVQKVVDRLPVSLRKWEPSVIKDWAVGIAALFALTALTGIGIGGAEAASSPGGAAVIFLLSLALIAIALLMAASSLGFQGESLMPSRLEAELRGGAALHRAERNRRRGILRDLRREYMATNQEASPEAVNNLEGPPKEWVVQQLQSRGENWDPDDYS